MSFSMLLAKKEFKGYFNSPSAYIILVVFLLINAWFFTSPLFLSNQADLRTLFGIIPIGDIFFYTSDHNGSYS